MARRKINFYRSDTDDLYDDSYANYFYDMWLSYNDVEENEGSNYARKCEFVRELSRLYDRFNLSTIGYEPCFMMEYINSSKCQRFPDAQDEYVLIWHNATMNSCTVIPVTGDSLEAMQRDIMRAVMR